MYQQRLSPFVHKTRSRFNSVIFLSISWFRIVHVGPAQIIKLQSLHTIITASHNVFCVLHRNKPDTYSFYSGNRFFRSTRLSSCERIRIVESCGLRSQCLILCGIRCSLGKLLSLCTPLNP